MSQLLKGGGEKYIRGREYKHELSDDEARNAAGLVFLDSDMTPFVRLTLSRKDALKMDLLMEAAVPAVKWLWLY